MNAPVAPPIKAARYIGERMPRKEDPRLLTGRGQFVDDISLPGMLHVAFARSQIARGDILSIDCAAAKEIPGVHAVMLAADLTYPGFQMMSMYLRPTEVDLLIGDPSKARDKLGWQATTGVREMIAEMVAADLNAFTDGR